MLSIPEQEICVYCLNNKKMDKGKNIPLTKETFLEALPLCSAVLSKLPKLWSSSQTLSQTLRYYLIPFLQLHWLPNVHEQCKKKTATQIKSCSCMYKKLSPSHCVPDFCYPRMPSYLLFYCWPADSSLTIFKKDTLHTWKQFRRYKHIQIIWNESQSSSSYYYGRLKLITWTQRSQASILLLAHLPRTSIHKPLSLFQKH